MNKVNEIVLPFYKQALTANKDTNPAEVLNLLLADSFESIGSADIKTREQLIGQLELFWKIIPDLRWEPQEIIENHNQVIIRSIATGTPNSPEGKFFGLPTNGTKSFQMMSVDIHTIENGKIAKVHHVEDWATAMKQVKDNI